MLDSILPWLFKQDKDQLFWTGTEPEVYSIPICVIYSFTITAFSLSSIHSYDIIIFAKCHQLPDSMSQKICHGKADCICIVFTFNSYHSVYVKVTFQQIAICLYSFSIKGIVNNWC